MLKMFLEIEDKLETAVNLSGIKQKLFTEYVFLTALIMYPYIQKN